MYSVVSSIQTRCALNDVNSIGCYRVGTSPNWQYNPPTVFVTVNAKTDRDWKALREDIVLILEDHYLPMVAVKIQADRVLRGNALSKEDTKIPASAPTGPAQVGQSVNSLDLRGRSDIFGGFLELRYSESQDWVPYGVTSFQCLPRGGPGCKLRYLHAPRMVPPWFWAKRSSSASFSSHSTTQCERHGPT